MGLAAMAVTAVAVALLCAGAAPLALSAASNARPQGAEAASAQGLPSQRTRLYAAAAPAQPTPPFPTLVPTEPLPTLPPSVPTPAPFTPTPTPNTAPSASATPATPISPTPSPTPTIEVTASATSFLGLANRIHLPYVALFHSRDPLVLEPLGIAPPSPDTRADAPCGCAAPQLGPQVRPRHFAWSP
jgi:hypothetical protein